jgi:t-SNARE complex subunit (syntaxin)
MDVKTNREINEEADKNINKSRHKAWVVSYIIIAVICIAVYFLLQFRVFGL